MAMAKRALASNEGASSTSTQHSTITPQRQQEQAIMLEPFYKRLIGMTFNDSASAIERCRDLCAEFGFTVKQEASTHRNIYVYCSREGLPDSLRNPKSNPQRKRPSKRCDCRWRVVLYENESHWEFRKSLNPEAGKHNHELMRPEEIERSWPKDVTVLICELARLRMSTQDIRSRVRGQFPNIHWNERRFYNRLSEERQKIKLRDSAERTHQLTDLWSKVCMATAGNDELSQFVKQEMIMLFQSICDTVQIDPESFPSPLLIKDDDEQPSSASTPSSSTGVDHQNNTNDELDTTTQSSIDGDTETTPKRSKKSTNSKQDNNTNTNSTSTTASAPKGFLQVEIPKQIYYIKIHNQRQLHETPLLKSQRRVRTYSEDQSTSTTLEPARKVSRKGKSRQSSSSLVSDDQQLQNEPMQHHSLSPLIPQQYKNNTNNNNTNNNNRVTTRHHHHQHQQHPHQTPTTTTFVYYENSNMPLDPSLSGYVNSTFQNTYNMPSTPSTPGFSTPELTFSFDPSMGRGANDGGNNNDSNEPTIHPALQSNPMSHQQQQQQQQQQESQQKPILQRCQQTTNNNSQRMYSLSSPNNDVLNKPSDPHQQQVRVIYESPKDNSNMRSLLPDNQQRSYQPQAQQQQQQQQQPPGLYIRQTTSPNNSNDILPMYSQQQHSPDTLNNIHQRNSNQ